MFREILVPLDGSWVSERIVSDARLLADATDGRLTFVHVLPPGSGPLMEVEHGMSRVDARAYLGGFVEEMGEAGSRARAVVLRGDPAEQLARFAAEEEIDVIAMTTHG
ncbi:MAG: universal stress protein, partial [Thermomicrobiaceae bacterium]|nr:universal stress protein [Thermomicrobiaceae bacterium]